LQIPEPVTIITQGHLFRVKVGRSDPPLSLPVRGDVTEFSRASRRRMLELCARLDEKRAGFCAFLTLTYPKRFPGPKTAKRHLKSFLERLRRRARYSGASAVWRLEPQARGAPHFHLIAFNFAYLPRQTARKWWAEIIHEYVDEWEPRVEVKKLRSWRGVMSYAAKYCAKPLAHAEVMECQRRAERDGNFINRAYLHGQDVPDTWKTPGRWWGVYNKNSLPLADVEYIRLPFGKWYHSLRRWASRVNTQIQGAPSGCTFRVFVNDASQWQRMALLAWQNDTPSDDELNAWWNRSELNAERLTLETEWKRITVGNARHAADEKMLQEIYWRLDFGWDLGDTD